MAGLATSLFAQFYAEYLSEITPGVSLAGPIAGFLFMSLLAGWIVRDSYQRGERKPYDFDTMVAFLWLLVAPLYLVRTRRWKGVLIILAAIIAIALIDLAAEEISVFAWERSL